LWIAGRGPAASPSCYRPVMTGAEFRTHRLTFKLTQLELAELFDVTEGRIQKWEKAALVPGVVELAVLHVLEHLARDAA
jgi:DNA-binding transcriptional regulator YiaG